MILAQPHVGAVLKVAIDEDGKQTHAGKDGVAKPGAKEDEAEAASGGGGGGGAAASGDDAAAGGAAAAAGAGDDAAEAAELETVYGVTTLINLKKHADVVGIKQLLGWIDSQCRHVHLLP